MFFDRKKELERLEAELLEEDAEQPEEEDPQALLEESFYHCAGRYDKKLHRRFRNADRVDLDPEELSRQVQKKGGAGCVLAVVLAVILLAAVFAWLTWRAGGLGGLEQWIKNL